MKAEVRGQRSEVRGQRSEVRGQEPANLSPGFAEPHHPGFAKPHPGLYCDALPGLRMIFVLAPAGRRNKAPGEALRTRGWIGFDYDSYPHSVPERPDRRHLRADLRTAGRHAGQLRARRFGHAVLADHRHLPVGAGRRRLAVAVHRHELGPCLHRGRARRRAGSAACRRRCCSSASPGWHSSRVVLYGTGRCRSARWSAWNCRCSCASSRTISISRTWSRAS